MVVRRYDSQDVRRYSGIVRHVESIGTSNIEVGTSKFWVSFYRQAQEVPLNFRSVGFENGLNKLERTVRGTQ
jgi:hypothetical protein